MACGQKDIPHFGKLKRTVPGSYQHPNSRPQRHAIVFEAAILTVELPQLFPFLETSRTEAVSCGHQEPQKLAGHFELCRIEKWWPSCWTLKLENAANRPRSRDEHSGPNQQSSVVC